MAYLFLDNSKKEDGVRTSILSNFFNALHSKELHPDFFLTDKDWAQINAASRVWPSTKIQLCLWHVKRAIGKRLADSSIRKEIITMLQQQKQTLILSMKISILLSETASVQKSTVIHDFAPKNSAMQFWI